MNYFILSQFGYCPLVWMFHSKTLNIRKNRLHERALRIAYKDTSSSFQKLLHKDNSCTIHERNITFLAIEMYKVHHDLAHLIMSELFPIRKRSINLRSGNNFLNRNVRTVYNGTNTISYQGPKISASLPTDFKNAISVIELKTKIKSWKPTGCTCRICTPYIQGLGFL